MTSYDGPYDEDNNEGDGSRSSDGTVLVEMVYDEQDVSVQVVNGQTVGQTVTGAAKQLEVTINLGHAVFIKNGDHATAETPVYSGDRIRVFDGLGGPHDGYLSIV